jgi:hypothetical protein
MEAADSLTRFVQAAPQTAVLIGDLIAKNQDWPGAQEVARRLKTIVPPQALSKEEREEMAKDQPAPEQQAPPPPDPRMMEIQVKMQIESEKLKMDMDMHKLNKDKLIAEIENIRATGLKSIAQAEALELGQQFAQYKLELQQLSQNVSHHVNLTLEQMRQNRGQGGQSTPGGNGQGDMGEPMGDGSGIPGEPQATPELPPNYMDNPGEMSPPLAMGDQQNPPGMMPEQGG